MKKSTKRTLASLAIILTFTISIIAGAVLNFTGQGQQTKFLNSTVVDGPIDTNVESLYIQNQYTFLRYYYAEKDALYEYISQLPDAMTLPTGETQLFVNRLESNETSALIVNLKGSADVTDLTQQGLFDALCENLMFTPTDCLLRNLEQMEVPQGNLSQNTAENTT